MHVTAVMSVYHTFVNINKIGRAWSLGRGEGPVWGSVKGWERGEGYRGGGRGKGGQSIGPMRAPAAGLSPS